MLQNGSIQLNVARHFNVSQTVISSSGTWTPTSGTIGHISSLLMAVPLSADGNGKSELIPTLKKKKKKRRRGNNLSNLPPKSSHARKDPPPSASVTGCATWRCFSDFS